jgi:hypothetical protein
LLLLDQWFPQDQMLREDRQDQMLREDRQDHCPILVVA